MTFIQPHVIYFCKIHINFSKNFHTTHNPINILTPTGIKNFEATCYLGSSIQALYNLYDFRKDVIQLSKRLNSNEGNNILTDIGNLFISLKNREHSEVLKYSKKIKVHIEKKVPSFMGKKQQGFNQYRINRLTD